VSEDARQQLPAPGWSPLTDGYWRAAHEGRLVVQRCGECGAHRWPPTWACYACQSTKWLWDDLPGTGTVFSFTWADSRPVLDSPLYNISIIEVDGTQGEPVRIMTQVVEVGKDDLRCDLPVVVCFEPNDTETSVPMFKPRA
jgi:uncharacterized OB-fold protein